MKELLRRLKLAYAAYNFFHPKELKYNAQIYKKLGLKKKYFSPVSSKDFAHLPANPSNNNQPAKKNLSGSLLYQKLNEENKESLENFEINGFAIIKNYLSSNEADAVNNEIDTLLATKKVKYAERSKIMFAIHQSSLLRNIGNNARLKELLSLLLDGKAVLFQSINFRFGSEQATHSDSIHMTTYPLGGLLGVWIALEDISEDTGPLHYYPGSHKLPYYLNADYENEGNNWLIGDKLYKDYEEMMRKKISEQKLEKVKFLAKKGDLLIWHANLFHGGEPHSNKNKTRKSMVFHYFKEGSICYHEISQRPAIIKRF
ncbi:MAG: phytanoyl-CoA dioxygenase [Sphingobacteriales bacterium]|nr:MAG: phytanoyl-CoA dioxygenase [Sphingobacteriales bacterium]